MTQYKEGSIVELDTGTFELKNNQWVPYSTPDLPGKPVEERGMMSELGRQAIGLPARYIAEAATALPGMIADVPSMLGRGLLGIDMPYPSASVPKALEMAGFPKPETEMERMVAAPSRALAGAGMGMGYGGLLGRGGEVAKGVGQTLKAAPGGQAMSAIGGGIGSQGAAEMGYGPLMQTLAGLTGGTVAPMAGYRAQRLTQPKIGPRQTAEKMVGRAMERDVLPEEALDLAKLGPEARLVDIGPNVRKLAEEVVSTPGKARTVAKSVLESRSKASTQRLINDARKFAGTDKDAFQSTKNIIQERRELSRPYYAKASKELVTLDDDFMSLMNRPAMKDAWNKGIVKAQNDPDWPADIKIPSAKDLAQGKTVPLIALDYTKRALDGKIQTALRGKEPDLDDARIFTDLKRKLTGPLDERYPDYRQAREVFSDRSSMLKSMELGKRILREDSDEMLEFVGDMTNSEKEMFVVGAMKSITDRLKGTVEGSNAARKIATPLVKERIRPAFPDDDSFNKFVQGLERENVFMESKGILGGSPTQPRQASGAQLGVEAMEFAAIPTETIMGKIKSFLGKARIPEKVKDEIAEILFLEQMAKPGTFSNKTVAKMRGYNIPKKQLNELANSLIAVQATQEQ